MRPAGGQVDLCRRSRIPAAGRRSVRRAPRTARRSRRIPARRRAPDRVDVGLELAPPGDAPAAARIVWREERTPAPAARHEGGSRPVQVRSRVCSTVASASPMTRQPDAATSAASVVLRPRPPSAHASWSASATRRTAATSAATPAAKMMSRSCSARTAEVPLSSYSASNSSSFRSRPAVGGQGASSATATTRRSENPCRRYCARHRPASGTLRCRCPQHPDPGPIVVYTSCAIAIPAPCRTAMSRVGVRHGKQTARQCLSLADSCSHWPAPAAQR